MRSRWTWMWVAAILLTLPGLSAAQTELSLEASLNAAIENSPQLAQSRAKQSAQRHQANAAKADRLPSLGLSGTGSWVSETMELNIPIMPQPITFGDNTSYDMAVAVRAPLYTGGSLSSRQKALEYSAEAGAMQTSVDSLSLLLQVRSSYFAAQMAEANYKAVHASLNRLERHKASLDKMLDIGMADEESMLELRAALAEVQQREAAAHAAVLSAQLELGRLIGRPGETIVPTDNLASSLMNGSSADGMVQARPDLEALERLGMSMEKQVSAQRGSLLPTVSAEAAYHYGKPGIDMISNEAMGYATAGVRLSWTLFDFGGRSQQVQAVREQERSLRQQKLYVQQMWITKLAVAKQKLAAAGNERASAQLRFELQQKRYGLVEGKFAQGQLSESGLLDAEDDLTLAELDLARALANERLTEAEVLHALGR